MLKRLAIDTQQYASKIGKGVTEALRLWELASRLDSQHLLNIHTCTCISMRTYAQDTTESYIIVLGFSRIIIKRKAEGIQGILPTR